MGMYTQYCFNIKIKEQYKDLVIDFNKGLMTFIEIMGKYPDYTFLERYLNTVDPTHDTNDNKWASLPLSFIASEAQADLRAYFGFLPPTLSDSLIWTFETETKYVHVVDEFIENVLPYIADEVINVSSKYEEDEGITDSTEYIKQRVEAVVRNIALRGY